MLTTDANSRCRHNALARLNGVFAFGTTVLLSLLVSVALTTFVISKEVKPAHLDVTQFQVVKGRSARDGQLDFAFTKFDVRADLTPLFHWNTKQVFVQFVAYYSSPESLDNQVVIWDRIVRRKRDAKINIEGLKNKYAFKDMSRKGFSGLNATFALRYNIMPHVGVLTYGEAGRTSPIPFPPPQDRMS